MVVIIFLVLLLWPDITAFQRYEMMCSVSQNTVIIGQVSVRIQTYKHYALTDIIYTHINITGYGLFPQ